MSSAITTTTTTNSTTTKRKIKILLFGSIGTNFSTIFIKKLKSLQSSKAGPFDICICVGSIQLTENDYLYFQNTNQEEGRVDGGRGGGGETLPIPVYLQEHPGILNISSNDAGDGTNGTPVPNSSSSENQEDIVPLGIKNLYYLKGNPKLDTTKVQFIKIVVLPEQQIQQQQKQQDNNGSDNFPLIVGLCSRRFISTNDTTTTMMKKQQQQQDKEMMTTTTTMRQQCDILLSSDWPQGMEDVVHVDTEPMSYDVAEAALECVPRYHIAPSTQYYHTSPPYHLPNSPHVGRFIGLAPVTAGKAKKSKDKVATTKFVHALGLIPLSANPPPTTVPSILPCPFISKPIAATTTTTTATSLSSIQKSTPDFVYQARQNEQSLTYSRFGPMKTSSSSSKRRRDDDDDNNNDNNNNENDQSSHIQSFEPPNNDSNLSTLFLHGLNKDVKGELQSTSSSQKILHIFQKKYNNVERVRYPTNNTKNNHHHNGGGGGTRMTSSYCFIDFSNQKDAYSCLLDCQGHITIDGVPLIIKWATPKGSNNNNNNNNNNSRQEYSKRMRQSDDTSSSQYQQQQQQHVHYVTHEQAKDSLTLYYHPPKKQQRQQQQQQQQQEKVLQEEFSSEELCKYMEKILENALNEGNGEDDERVTAETEPALKVELRTIQGQVYGFLEFASHAAATMALAAVTNSTDGGYIVENPANAASLPPKKNIIGTTLRWARGGENNSAHNKSRSTNNHNNDGRHRNEEVLEALGLKRQFFPADTRTDCWFCLASPTCETHLITGVYQEWYMTMPKGPAHRGHVLLVSVSHTHLGAWTFSSKSISEWTNLVKQLQRHAYEVYDESNLIIFERAMETKGGYHTHIHCIPIPKDCTIKIQSTMLAHAKASGFDLRSIQSDLSISTLLDSSDNHDNHDSSYFYAEIVTPTSNFRYFYKPTSSSSTTISNNNKSGGNGNVNGNDNHKSIMVPLQFGREVLASVLGNPKLAHWKSCLLQNKEEEIQYAKEFRTSFEKKFK